MARRVLLRAGKDPFRIVSAEDTLASNLIGNNSGNLLFSTAAYKLLSAPDTEVVANGLFANPADGDRINREFDCFVTAGQRLPAQLHQAPDPVRPPHRAVEDPGGGAQDNGSHP